MKMSYLKNTLNLIYAKINYLFVVFVFLYTVAALIVPIKRYWQFQDFYFDFGIFDRAIWQVSRFQPPFVDHVDISPTKDIILLGDHFNPSMFLLSPLYWLTSRSEILLVAQSLIVVASGIIAYILALKLVKNKLIALSLGVAYLGYVGLQNALITDLHDATIAVLPLMVIFWCIYFKKWPVYFISLLILLGLKESFAGLGVGIGLYLLLKTRSFNRIGLATIAISLIWGLLAISLIIPYFSQGVYLYKPKDLPTTPASFVTRFISPPLKPISIGYTYLTFGLIPLFDVALLPAVFENYFERFVLFDDRGIDLGMHYNAPLTPLMFVGALDVIIWLQKKRVKWLNYYALFVLGTVFLLHQHFIHGPLALAYNSAFYQPSQGFNQLNDFLTHIPSQGLIMTQNDLATRFTHRQVKLLRTNYKSINPNQVVLNLAPDQNPNNFFPLTYQQTLELKNELQIDSNYKLEKFGDQFYFFSKKN